MSQTRDKGGSSPTSVGLACALLLLSATTVFAVELERVVRGLSRPLFVTHAGDGSNRLFIVEQGGKILVHKAGGVRDEPFLDLSSEISTGGERGLLGLAFHPNYPENGFFFVNYTDRRGDTVIARFGVSSDPDRADASSEVEVLSFRQPFSNHNGGHLAFGPDGYLYIGSGDGGSGGDPQDNGQSLDTVLGKILRLDVDGLPVAIPPDNPFVGQGGAREEIWVWGLRNPWRFSFDRRTGDLLIGDVGQNREEEIDFQAANSAGGENFGWRRKEGSLCFEPPSGCSDPSFIDPIIVYGRESGCSVTGGYRYRGRANPELVGTYVFGDFCSGSIWGARPAANGSWSTAELAQTGLSISSFGEDESGELYVVDLAGGIYKIAGSALLSDDFESGDTDRWRKTRGNATVVQPGLGGSDHALRVTLDGTRVKSRVVTTAARREASLSVQFLFASEDVDLGGREVEILELVGSDGQAMVWMTLSPKGARFRASLWVRSDSGEAILVGSTKVKRVREVKLGIRWERASGRGSSDGVAQLIRGRRVRAQRADLVSGSQVLRSVALGLPAGSTGTGGGSLIFDEVVITR